MNLTYLIARYNINYQKAYEYYLISCYMNKNEILENHKDTYLTSITQALFEYDNKKYIVKDCHVFLELLRIFKKFLKEPIDNIN